MKKTSFKFWATMAFVLLLGFVSIAATVGDRMTYEGPVTFKVSPSLDGNSFSNVMIATETLTAADTILAAECGKTFYLNSATEFATALPALSTVSAGCRFKFVVNAAPSGANYTVTTGNSLENQIFGLAVVNGASVAGASEDTITFTGAAAVKGDWVELESDGTSWYVVGQAVAATGITLTAAD